VVEIYRLLAQSKKAAGLPKAGSIDFLPVGFEACRPGLSTIVNYALQQNLMQQKSTLRSCSTTPPARSGRKPVGPDRAIGSRQFSL